MIELWLWDEAWHARQVTPQEPNPLHLDFPALQDVGTVLNRLHARFPDQMVAVVDRPDAFEPAGSGVRRAS